jgi:hypothetical protein
VDKGKGWCYAVAADGIVQFIGSTGFNSDNMDAHRSYFGDDHCVYLIWTENTGETKKGAARATLSNITQDGFEMTWNETINTTVQITYNAYK